MPEQFVNKAAENGYVQMAEGVERKTLITGQATQLCAFRMYKGKQMPPHKHPQEQTGYLITGHLLLTIGGRQYEIKPGDSWTIPGNTEHAAEVLEDAVAIEVFSPIRQEYL